MIRLELRKKKNPPRNSNRLLAYKIQNHKYFETIIIFCIFFSTIIMGMQYYQMNKAYEENLEKISLILTFIYNLEALIKFIALQ